MSHEVKFDGVDGARKAMNYAIAYNRRGMRIIIKGIKLGEITSRFALGFTMAFAGIQGYPVECFANRYNLA